LAKEFPTSIVALEESFTADQLRQDTAERMRERVTKCPLPPTAELAGILTSGNLSKRLADVDTLVYAAGVHYSLAVVTADKQLAKAVQAKGLRVGNVAVVLRELVATKKLTSMVCENLLIALAARKDFLLGTPTPTWTLLKNLSFPD
jgi:hypothetical protein